MVTVELSMREHFSYVLPARPSFTAATSSAVRRGRIHFRIGVITAASLLRKREIMGHVSHVTLAPFALARRMISMEFRVETWAICTGTPKVWDKMHSRLTISSSLARVMPRSPVSVEIKPLVYNAVVFQA